MFILTQSAAIQKRLFFQTPRALLFPFCRLLLLAKPPLHRTFRRTRGFSRFRDDQRRCDELLNFFVRIQNIFGLIPRFLARYLQLPLTIETSGHPVRQTRPRRRIEPRDRRKIDPYIHFRRHFVHILAPRPRRTHSRHRQRRFRNANSVRHDDRDTWRKGISSRHDLDPQPTALVAPCNVFLAFALNIALTCIRGTTS